MSAGYLIEPDTKLIRDVVAMGGSSLKKCFQCSTCTVVCSLSPDENPFPRKEMIWSQWGLRQRLMEDPDIWLCHQCTDCSKYCPRDAKPADVLAALRRVTIMHYSVPRFAGRLLSSPAYLPLVLLFPAILLFVLLWGLGDRSFPQGEIVPSRLVPISHIYIGMAVLAVLVLPAAAIALSRFWKNISAGGQVPAKKSFTSSFVASVIDILKHSNQSKCGVNKPSYYTHFGIFYGFGMLSLAALIGAVYHFSGIESPYPLISPVKLAGNLGAVLVAAGLVVAVGRRLAYSDATGRSTYFDWFLLLTLFFTAMTGVATEVIRISGLATATYTVYLVHLWLVFTLLLYAPFYKGSHLLYRTLAMTYARQIGREGK